LVERVLVRSDFISAFEQPCDKVPIAPARRTPLVADDNAAGGNATSSPSAKEIRNKDPAFATVRSPFRNLVERGKQVIARVREWLMPTQIAWLDVAQRS
jgi:hypothetical protein